MPHSRFLVALSVLVLVGALSLPAHSEAAGGLDARATGYPYPHEVATWASQAQGQSVEMAYMDVAPAGAPNGETVVLLHGKNFSGAYWASTITALSGRGFRVVVPDQVGFGQSSKPEHFQYTFAALATLTAALLDDVEVSSVHVVGHSMGGMLASRFALMFPARVSSLTLVNPIGLEDWSRVVPYKPVQWWFESEKRKTVQGVRAYMTESYFDGKWKPEYEPLLELQAGWIQGPDYDRIAWSSALAYDMIFTQPVVYEFGHIQAPTLLIVGGRDRTALGKPLVSPAMRATMGDYRRLAKAAAAAIPNAQLELLDGVGHVPQFEAPEPYLEALLGFLGR